MIKGKLLIRNLLAGRPQHYIIFNHNRGGLIIISKFYYRTIVGFLVFIWVLLNSLVCSGESLILKQAPSSVKSGGKSDGDIVIAHFNESYVILKRSNTYFRLSNCLKKNSSCGYTAANYFCRSNGYKRADYFETENCSNTGAAVFWVKENSRCTGLNCTCFAFIDCN